MGTKEIIQEIKRMPINKRILIIERTIQSIKESEVKNKMKKAVDILVSDYENDTELTVFTNLDFESFYEAR
ncbi:MAG: hypothetical protein K8R58_09095 [Bacteroidales bacterium]|nr:hypothetical protein [Bacteroidales bacterium]